MVKNSLLIFVLIAMANYGLGANFSPLDDDALLYDHSLCDDKASFFAETIEQLSQDPLTWKEKFEFTSVRYALLSSAALVFSLMFATIPVGVSCGLRL